MTVTNGVNGGCFGRAENGRFASGNKFARGRRPSPYRAYADAIRDAVTPDDLRRIVAVVREKALQGSLHAAEILLNRLAGKVRKSVNIKIDDSLPQKHSLDYEDEETRDYLKTRYPDRYGV